MQMWRWRFLPKTKAKRTRDLRSVDKTSSHAAPRTIWTDTRESKLKSRRRCRRRASESLSESWADLLGAGKGEQSLWLRTVDSGSIQKWRQLIWLIFMHQRHSRSFTVLVVRFLFLIKPSGDFKTNFYLVVVAVVVVCVLDSLIVEAACE